MNKYQVRVSHEAEDAAWDAFVADTAGGHHVQTSLWAQLKACLGWRALRLVVTEAGTIVGGAQLLLWSLPTIGSIGYVPKGPLVAVNDPLLIKLLIDQLKQIARDHRIQILALQPPDNGETTTRQLLCRGYRPSAFHIGHTATVLIDLTQELDEILARMKPRTRYNIRLGQRKGITVWEGTERDLPQYYELLLQTSQRQGFTPYPKEYFLKMWRLLSPDGFLKLFFAELDGKLVSAQLAVPFGDRVINKLSVWSGNHGSSRPNEVLLWAAIEWSKFHGYRYYDLEGINVEAVKSVLRGEPIPASLKQSVTSFKLGFGGEVVLLPGVYDYSYHPLVNWGYRNALPKMINHSIVHRIVNRILTLLSIGS